MSHFRLLVCDLDNTLYDWVSYFVPSFYRMVDEVVTILGCDREKLLDDFRTVHLAHRDSEHPFALMETRTIKERFSGKTAEEVFRVLDPAFHAFNSARKANLKVHNGVINTLEELLQAGVRLVAHTESRLYSAVDRLERLSLSKFFSRIYCRERSINSDPFLRDKKSGWLDKYPMEKVIELSHHQSKPDPSVLIEICRSQGVPASESAYVGDSVARDMLMAKRAGVFSIWAEYGAKHDPKLYEALVRISHWSSNDVQNEIKLREEARAMQPDFIAKHGFSEVLDVFELQNIE